LKQNSYNVPEYKQQQKIQKDLGRWCMDTVTTGKKNKLESANVKVCYYRHSHLHTWLNA